MGKPSRDKGKRFERLIRGALEPFIVTYEHAGTAEADLVVEGPDQRIRLHLEVKNQAQPKLAVWWRQAVEQTPDREFELPVLVHKRHGRTDPADQWVTMDIRTFNEILEAL